MTGETWRRLATPFDRLNIGDGTTTPDPCTDPRCVAARHTAADRDEHQRHHADDLEADNAQLRRENAALRRRYEPTTDEAADAGLRGDSYV